MASAVRWDRWLRRFHLVMVGVTLQDFRFEQLSGSWGVFARSLDSQPLSGVWIAGGWAEEEVRLEHCRNASIQAVGGLSDSPQIRQIRCTGTHITSW